MVRLDATIVVAHSDKQQAKGTFKGTYGHHPLTAWCDNTGESLAVMLRPGNAGSNTAADHIAVIGAAIAQIPARHRRKMLVTCDGAGATHALVEHITALNARPGYQVHYSAGFDFDERIRAVLPRLPGTAWTPALDADGTPRPGRAGRRADRAAAPQRRRRPPRQLAGGHADPDPPGEPAPRRAAVPVRAARGQALPGHRDQYPARPDPVPRSPPPDPGTESRTASAAAKAPACGHLPSRDYQVNTAWCQAASIACDLLAWLRLLALDGDLAKAEPKTLRYKILHTAGRIVKGQRRRHLKIAASWPWARDIAERVHPDPGPAAAMTRPPRPRYPERNRQAGRGTGAHPTRQPGGTPRRTPKTEDQELTRPGRQASDVTPVNDRG